MSLLNDMLRDLSNPAKSGGNTSVEADVLILNDAEQRELFSQSSAAKPLSRSLVPSIIVFVLVLAGIISARYFFSETATPAATLTTQNIPEVDAPALNIPASTVPVVNAPVANVPAPELGERLAALETAVTSLTTVLAETQLQKVNSEPLTAAASQHVPELAADSVSIQEPFAAVPVMASSVAEEPAVKDAAAGQVLNISPNVRWQDQQFAVQAQKKFSAGQVELTITELQNFIASQAAPLESTKLLLDILLEQENVPAVQQRLAQAEFLPEVEKRYYSAKVALLSGLDTEAISLLEQSLAEAESHENYRALLAGLYQRNGMNQEAASHYRRLLAVFGEKPAYWLGFALAQDALNQPQLAIQAYQRVNQYADLQPPVRTYIEQRLAALQQ